MQHGMRGTAIVFGNASAEDALASFPPSADVLQDSFVAVFVGSENPDVILTPEQQERQAKEAMRREVELHVCKAEYEAQAELLMRTNYVYNARRGGYRADLVAELPVEPSLPRCFEACARFVPRSSTADDATTALGPSGSTTAAQQEREADDEEEPAK